MWTLGLALLAIEPPDEVEQVRRVQLVVGSYADSLRALVLYGTSPFDVEECTYEAPVAPLEIYELRECRDDAQLVDVSSEDAAKQWPDDVLGCLSSNVPSEKSCDRLVALLAAGFGYEQITEHTQLAHPAQERRADHGSYTCWYGQSNARWHGHQLALVGNECGPSLGTRRD